MRELCPGPATIAENCQDPVKRPSAEKRLSNVVTDRNRLEGGPLA
ncbi:hypothetical protein GCM10027075_64030 [Streptomyces heilongjiangensis]